MEIKVNGMLCDDLVYRETKKSTIKIIDLLNKIANGEEVPKYIEYRNWNNNKFEKMLVCKENIFCKLDQLEIYLNDEVEIIKEQPTIFHLSTPEEDWDVNLRLTRIEDKIKELVDVVNKLK